jgi:hypothetical protein
MLYREELQFGGHPVSRQEYQLACCTPEPANCNEHYQFGVAGEMSLPFLAVSISQGGDETASSAATSPELELESQGGGRLGKTVDRFLLQMFLFISNTVNFCRGTTSHFEGNKVCLKLCCLHSFVSR